MKLFNKGQRNIHMEAGILTPQQTIRLDDELGKKLMRLYPGELVDVEGMDLGDSDIAKMQSENSALRKEISELKSEIFELKNPEPKKEVKTSSKASK